MFCFSFCYLFNLIYLFFTLVTQFSICSAIFFTSKKYNIQKLPHPAFHTDAFSVKYHEKTLSFRYGGAVAAALYFLYECFLCMSLRADSPIQKKHCF